MSAMNESPTRSGMNMQFGHSVTDFSISAEESAASPEPCPYVTSSDGSLSYW